MSPCGSRELPELHFLFPATLQFDGSVQLIIFAVKYQHAAHHRVVPAHCSRTPLSPVVRDFTSLLHGSP